MPFEPGQSGNPTGAKPNKRFLDALNRAIAQDDSKKLREAAEKVLEFASAGEPWAVQFLADRLDGKAHQSTSLENSDGSPLLSGITVTFAKPDSSVPG